MNCDKCTNAGICKYEDNARRVETELLEWLGNSQKPEVITCMIKCDKFHLKYATTKAVAADK